MIAAKLALLATALFAGAAAYITFVEQPARLLLPTRWALDQWRPSYARATLMQAPAAAVGSIAGVAAWLNGEGLCWLIAGLLVGAVIPFTLIVIFPTNARLKDAALDPDGDEARHLLVRWGRLHAVRTMLGVLAFLVMLAAP